MKIAIIGDRGIPARYSGFSTLVEHLALGLVADHGFEVTVYCRREYYESHPPEYGGVRCVWLPAPGGKSFESIVHSNLGILHAVFQGFDLVFIVDPGNAPFCLPLKLRRVPTVIHTDGLGWKRQKWGPMQRRYYKWSESICARWATWLVTDSRAMQAYYQAEYGAPSTFIPYSGDVGVAAGAECLTEYGLEPGGYYLVVARMEPDNNVDLIIREYRASGIARPLVVVGGARYPSDYSRSIMAESDDQVRCLGSIYGSDNLNALYAHCRVYLHGHEVGGTNPSLLRAMHGGAACAVLDVPFNREVVGEEAFFFSKHPGDLAECLRRMEAEGDLVESYGKAARHRSCAHYRWDAVVAAYAELFRCVLDARTRRLPCREAIPGQVYRPEDFVLEQIRK